ncbi:6971_t:CDS:1, partial [Racocetra persica]
QLLFDCPPTVKSDLNANNNKPVTVELIGHLCETQDLTKSKSTKRKAYECEISTIVEKGSLGHM